MYMISRKHDRLDGIWKRDLYTRDIEYIINNNIYEYDMKDAGFNLSKYYNLLDTNTLTYLESLGKRERTIRIGVLMGNDRVFSKKLTLAFGQMRRIFMLRNNLKPSDILSIKKDAIYVVNNICEDLEFGNMKFVMKNKYTSFHKFNYYELYFRNKYNQLDVKGIDDDKVQPHMDYFMKFLKDIFRSLENTDNSRVINKISQFASDYKSLSLNIEYYRNEIFTQIF